MIWLIIFIVFVITFGIISFKKMKDKFDWFTSFIMLSVFVFIFLLIIDCGAIGESMVKTTETSMVVASQDIVALKDDSSMSGSFFLGSGYIGEREYYVYCADTQHGYKVDKLAADSENTPVYIKYISFDETPHIDRYSMVSQKTLIKKANIWFSIYGYIKYSKYKPGDIVSETIKSPPLFSSTEHYNNYRYVIYIPEGSIQENYEIDLE